MLLHYTPPFAQIIAGMQQAVERMRGSSKKRVGPCLAPWLKLASHDQQTGLSYHFRLKEKEN